MVLLCVIHKTIGSHLLTCVRSRSCLQIPHVSKQWNIIHCLLISQLQKFSFHLVFIVSYRTIIYISLLNIKVYVYIYIYETTQSLCGQKAKDIHNEVLHIYIRWHKNWQLKSIKIDFFGWEVSISEHRYEFFTHYILYISFGIYLAKVFLL